MAWTAPRTWTDGELVTKAIMDPHVRDNFLAVPHLIARKTADESVISSTTFQDDDHLFFTIGVNEVWQVQYPLMVRADPAGDIKIQFTGPSGCLPVLSALITPGSGGAPLSYTWTALSTSQSLGITSATVSEPILISGDVVNGGTGGTFMMQWAQVGSSGTATKVMANSAIVGMKLA